MIKRTWRQASEFEKAYSSSPCRQVYVWLKTADGRMAIVSKDGEKWQLPGGKPEKEEAFSETAVRELREETGIEASEFSDDLQFFGYYEIVEDGPDNQPYKYLQVRYALHVPYASDQLPDAPYTEDDSQLESEKIKHVRYVTSDEIMRYIPWMKESAEAQVALATLAAPLTRQ